MVRASSSATPPPELIFDPGPRPELAWLPVACLQVDPTYQRTIEGRISQAAIHRIAAKFKWNRFGVAMVVEANDGIWMIIDGQHRVEAARLKGIKMVPCVVMPPMSVEEQASIFLDTNEKRVRVNAYAIHHARLAAADPVAVETNELCLRAGIEIPRYPIPKERLGAGQTLAIGTIVKACGDRNGTRAVVMVGKAYAAQPGGISAALFRAAWIALDEQVPVDNIQRFLDRREPVASAGGGTFSTAAVRDIVAKMARAADHRPNVVAGLDPKRLMGSR
ncbi:MAG: hypothetical protein JWO51_185 [Rhodospirillales bacterium]|nr:hypothetical protein [Rhodospirillales bacterium]